MGERERVSERERVKERESEWMSEGVRAREMSYEERRVYESLVIHYCVYHVYDT